MSQKPIFVATHPRACSTAFERVFMTRRDTVQCVHEPFGDAFYYGPERLSERFADDEQTRVESGFSQSTFKTVLDRIEREASEGKRIFIKDIIHYLLPPDRQPVSIAPSLNRIKRGVGTEAANNRVHMANGVNRDVNGHAAVNWVNGHSHANGTNGHCTNGAEVNGTNGAHGTNGVNGANGTNGATHTKGPYPYDTAPEPGNPTVMPKEILERFHFVFLIRDPHHSVPSYYRCTLPPLVEVNGWYNYDPSESGYDELRRTFQYLRKARLIGPNLATRDEVVDEVDGVLKPVTTRSKNTAYDSGNDICVVDADEMLEKPAPTMEALCNSVGLKYDPAMLNWDTEEEHEYACAVFEKWKGFHDDVLQSRALNPKTPKHHVKTEEEYDAEWRSKYGDEAAALIRRTVDENMADYLYMKQFTMKV